MNWYPALEALRDHLAAATSPGVVVLGGEARVPREQRVIILRGPSKQGDQRRGEESTLRAWIECWEHSTDTDAAAGYELLATLETTITEALRTFGQQLQEISGARVRVTIGEWDGDGDVFRPSIGSRVDITINMRVAG